MRISLNYVDPISYLVGFILKVVESTLTKNNNALTKKTIIMHVCALRDAPIKRVARVTFVSNYGQWDMQICIIYNYF